MFNETQCNKLNFIYDVSYHVIYHDTLRGVALYKKDCELFNEKIVIRYEIIFQTKCLLLLDIFNILSTGDTISNQFSQLT